MRILYLSPCGRMGGAETSLRELLASLRAAKPDWELWLVLGEAGPLEASARALGVKVIVEPFPPALARLGDSGQRPAALLWPALGAVAAAVRYTRRLAAIQRAIQPDILHTNGFKMHVLGVWARPRGTPVIWHIRDYASSRPVMRRLLRMHAARCAAAVANSTSVAGDIQAVCGPRLHVACIYNAVDLARYSPEGEKADLDALSGLAPASPETIRIGLVATMARWKGQAIFLRALERLPGDLKFRGYVVGGPIYQTDNSQRTLEELRKLAEDLRLREKVGFTGFVSDTGSVLRRLDVVVHASTEPEPFGRVIAEAMACGRPVITSGLGGARELITEGDNALAYPPGDPAALAECMLQLARAPERRERMGRAGRATAERRFDPSRLAAELIPLYRRVMAQASPRISAQLEPLP